MPPPSHRTLALLVLLLATFVDLVGATVLQVVLPAIRQDLTASPAQLQWIVAGYTLALALGMIPGARLGDLLGHKRVFAAGMAGFGITSAICALATTPNLLIAGRVLQGLAAAAMIPQVISQLQVMYEPAERGGPMAAFTTITSLAAAGGPILGPLLLAWGSTWRLTFWVNVPIAALALIACFALLPDSRSPDTGRIRLDLPGLALSSAGLVLVLCPLIDIANAGGRSVWTYVCIAAGLAVLGCFVAYERKIASPLLETALFRFRSLRGGLLTLLLFFAPTVGFFVTFMIFLQTGVGMSPLHAGLTMVVWSLAVAVTAGLSAGVLLPRIGRLAVQLGLVVMAFGFVVIAYVSASATAHTTWTDFIVGALVGGAGMGLVIAPLLTLTLNDVPVSDAGSSSGLYNTANQLAAAVGVAVVGTFFFTQVNPRSVDQARAYGSALATTLWLGIGMLALALAATFLLPRRFATAPQPEEPVRQDA
ncbi:MFS transporter [Fodinicola feengrottensis]|uniref:MFS transporter n=1 Tax=Fodinicola feengrottensis TaxID=435914 RepID=A0ABN2HML2_9ACTN|nr:MFS transporter [Fodinicola feengrottensis]